MYRTARRLLAPSHNNSGGNRTCTYDDENRLVNVILGTTYNSGFTYDGLGRLRTRVEYTWNGSSWVPNTTTEYIYDGMRVIQERNVNNTPTVSYTRGPDLSGTMEGAGGIGGLLARSSGYSGGNWTTHHFYHADGNGNITYLVDSSQALAASYRYDPFGNTLSSNGTQASANVYRFSSKEINTDTGMYYYGYRFFDPNLQRWLNRDPVAENGGINLYEFALNRPTFRVDPNGKAAWLVPVACGAAIAIIAYEWYHHHECSKAHDRWKAALAKCREQWDRVSVTDEGFMRFIDTYGGGNPSDAIINCAARRDPGAVKELIKACGKVAASSEFGGSLPEIPVEGPVE